MNEEKQTRARGVTSHLEQKTWNNKNTNEKKGY